MRENEIFATNLLKKIFKEKSVKFLIPAKGLANFKLPLRYKLLLTPFFVKFLVPGHAQNFGLPIR